MFGFSTFAEMSIFSFNKIANLCAIVKFSAHSQVSKRAHHTIRAYLYATTQYAKGHNARARGYFNVNLNKGRGGIVDDDSAIEMVF